MYDPSNVHGSGAFAGIRLFNAYNPAYRLKGAAVRFIIPDGNVHTYLIDNNR